jgi:hypothetical protein
MTQGAVLFQHCCMQDKLVYVDRGGVSIQHNDFAQFLANLMVMAHFALGLKYQVRGKRIRP